jgi:hypothetical protein
MNSPNHDVCARVSGRGRVVTWSPTTSSVVGAHRSQHRCQGELGSVELYLTTAVATDAFGTSLVYALRFLPKGDYTIALTHGCGARLRRIGHSDDRLALPCSGYERRSPDVHRTQRADTRAVDIGSRDRAVRVLAGSEWVRHGFRDFRSQRWHRSGTSHSAVPLSASRSESRRRWWRRQLRLASAYSDGDEVVPEAKSSESATKIGTL